MTNPGEGAPGSVATNPCGLARLLSPIRALGGTFFNPTERRLPRQEPAKARRSWCGERPERGGGWARRVGTRSGSGPAGGRGIFGGGGRGGDGSKSRNQYRKAEHSEHARSRRSSAAGRPEGERAERAHRRARPTSSRDGAASTALRRRSR